MKKLLVLALALTAAGCEDPAGPEGPGRLVAFSAEAQGGSAPMQPEVNVFATGGRLDVQAAFAGDPCSALDAKLVNSTGPADEPALTLRVEFRRTSSACVPVVARYGYQATIQAPSGTYFLHVTHHYVDGVIPEPLTVFASPIVVP
jgi:hypothetical protein